MRRWAFLAVMGITSCAFGATEFVDQSSVFPDASWHVVSPEYTVAQTFTVGQEGQFGHLTMAILKTSAATHTLTIDLRPTVGGVPVVDDQAALASVVLQPSDLPMSSSLSTSVAPIGIDFSSAHLQVHAGQVLAIVARSDEPYAPFSGYWWRETTQGHDSYGRGAAWLRSTNFFYTLGSNSLPQDMWFETTMSVPEPNVAAVLVALLAPVIGRRVRRRE
jgi:hypothetical protein